MTAVSMKASLEETPYGRSLFLVCEVCNKKIIQNQKKEEGMIFWNDNSGILAHKECMKNSADDVLYPNSEELKPLIFNILHNSKINLKEDEFSI